MRLSGTLHLLAGIVVQAKVTSRSGRKLPVILTATKGKEEWRRMGSSPAAVVAGAAHDANVAFCPVDPVSGLIAG